MLARLVRMIAMLIPDVIGMEVFVNKEVLIKLCFYPFNTIILKNAGLLPRQKIVFILDVNFPHQMLVKIKVLL